ncbi:hypothetical protein PACTADRAFT_49782 [Pachysolen tannophilus NRRL Y-2460]|uniref:NADH dehydrogenase [ubiquinone] 1 beta subcomplex subunit 9 n=1 Tax=Pachysolen tannophilus NRRL Y-2460 TaxID=669874 RepID=A0A1E4TXE5_PACTA|nr:hypothetical protein PACTADRAFT_49782 [Pachysolen tannophilus NRRL Y-2460]
MSPPVVPFSAQNVKLVSSLYRRSLRTTRDWINRPDLYRLKALEIRNLFEANRAVEDPNKLKTILDDAESLLTSYAHPDPIIPPCRPGGTRFERNIPPRSDTMVPSDV